MSHHQQWGHGGPHTFNIYLKAHMLWENLIRCLENGIGIKDITEPLRPFSHFIYLGLRLRELMEFAQVAPDLKPSCHHYSRLPPPCWGAFVHETQCLQHETHV